MVPLEQNTSLCVWVWDGKEAFASQVHIEYVTA